MRATIQRVCVCAGALVLAACASIGPQTVVRDRFDYVAAISDSWKQQTLLNLVKVRYADAPVFLDITSVIGAYTVGADANIGGQVAAPDRGSAFASGGVGGQYADKPTITYQPLSGDKFARSLMAPIPITSILSLIQAGYPADVVLRICVNSINGIENDFGGVGNPRGGNPKFYELMTALRQSQNTGGSGFRTLPTSSKQTVVMFFPPVRDEVATPLAARIRELLGLDGTSREFTVIYGSFPEPDGQIAILSRSMLQVMIDFASQIDVPEADVAEGRVYRRERTPEQTRMFPPLMAVHTGTSAPGDAYTAVRYRDRWFWVDDRDQQSKRMLTLLMMIFSLTESVPSQAAPIVTIPAR